MNKPIQYLRSIRRRTGVSLKDTATIIGIDESNLAKYEHDKRDLNINIVIAYHLIFNIPISKLLKNHYSMIVSRSHQNIKLLYSKLSADQHHRKLLIETIVNRLDNLKSEYV